MTDPRTCLECEGRCWVSVDLTDRTDVVSHTGFVKCPDCGGSGREPEPVVDAVVALGLSDEMAQQNPSSGGTS